MRGDVRFWFRGQMRSVEGVSPQKSVLRWLREDETARGTKEGCAEGDCGACTVALGTLDATAPGGLRIRAVNSCLLFFPALDGHALFTVEDLATLEGGETRLHPIQRALVDHHGSQCGFCTPGFAMSLWADSQERTSRPSRAEVISVLAGNLCRCTGYKPIIDAALAAWDSPPVPVDARPIVKALAVVDSEEPLNYGKDDASWYAPRTLADLARHAEAQPESRLIAGATDLALWVNKGLKDLGPLLSVAGVSELQQIRTEGGDLLLGAAVPLTDAFQALVKRYPQLAELADRFASPPVRNAGTLGGNVANGSPIGDSPPVLLALGASVVLRRGKTTRELPLDQFFLAYQKTARQPGEVLVALRVPELAPRTLFRAWKVSKRRDQDISAVCGAFSITTNEQGTVTAARLAYGGMAAVPKRAAAAEKALVGQHFDAEALELARQAMDQDFKPLTDGRATAAYRQLVAKNLLTRLHAEAGAL